MLAVGGRVPVRGERATEVRVIGEAGPLAIERGDTDIVPAQLPEARDQLQRLETRAIAEDGAEVPRSPDDEGLVVIRRVCLRDRVRRARKGAPGIIVLPQ